jgi:hypothetical protein
MCSRRSRWGVVPTGEPATSRGGLTWAVNLGGDADTNGAVAGALLGARFGSRGIPARWLDLLEPRDELVRLADALAAGDESSPAGLIGR